MASYLKHYSDSLHSLQPGLEDYNIFGNGNEFHDYTSFYKGITVDAPNSDGLFLDHGTQLSFYNYERNGGYSLFSFGTGSNMKLRIASYITGPPQSIDIIGNNIYDFNGNKFLKSGDSSDYITSDHLTHANIAYTGVPTFLGGININGGDGSILQINGTNLQRTDSGSLSEFIDIGGLTKISNNSYTDFSLNGVSKFRISGSDNNIQRVSDGGVSLFNKDTTAMRNIISGAFLANADTSVFTRKTGTIFTGDVQGLSMPLTTNSFTTKNYIDNLITGITWKNSVKVKTTANITLSGIQTIDGIAVASGNRILVNNQTTVSQNGIYIASAGAWVRSTDADNGDELSTATVAVMLGTVNKNTQWTYINGDVPIVGTDPINFGQISGAGTYTNGTYTTLTGNVFDINLSSLNGLYPQLSGSYSNPSWISSLAYSKLTGVPTNVSSFSNDAAYHTNATADLRYPQLSGSYSNPSWITALQYNKLSSIPSNSLIGNPTGTTGSASAVTYFDSGEETYTGTIAWTATTAPSGTSNNTYQWTQIGKMVTVRLNLNYATAGTAITKVLCDFPVDLPTPRVPNGFDSSNSLPYSGAGGMMTGPGTPIAVAGRNNININGGVFKFGCVTSSANYTTVELIFTYWTN